MWNYTAGFNETCHLSPHARGVSTLISAAAGSVIGIITDDFLMSLYKILSSWALSALRIVMTGAWFVYEAFQLHRVEGGDQFCDFYQEIPVFRHLVPDFARFGVPFDTDTGVNVFGWIGWLWVTIYVPVVNTMWLVGNWSDASGMMKFARASSVGLSALPLTMDTKARYGDVLEKYLGKPFRWLFTLISAVACLYLGLLTVLLLLLCCLPQFAESGAIFRGTIYALLMVIFTFFSFDFQTPIDEGRVALAWKAGEYWSVLLYLLYPGVSAMLYVAAPAFIAMAESPESPGIGLEEYIACESAPLWRKVIAVLP